MDISTFQTVSPLHCSFPVAGTFAVLLKYAIIESFKLSKPDVIKVCSTILDMVNWFIRCTFLQKMQYTLQVLSSQSLVIKPCCFEAPVFRRFLTETQSSPPCSLTRHRHLARNLTVLPGKQVVNHHHICACQA